LNQFPAGKAVVLVMKKCKGSGTVGHLHAGYVNNFEVCIVFFCEAPSMANYAIVEKVTSMRKTCMEWPMYRDNEQHWGSKSPTYVLHLLRECVPTSGGWFIEIGTGLGASPHFCCALSWLII
jgi:hypothetical protein